MADTPAPKQLSPRDILDAAAAKGRADREAAAMARQAQQQQQSQVPGAPNAPPPSAAPGATLPWPLNKIVEGGADASQAFLNRASFGGLPALEKKFQDAVGFKGPTPQEQAAAAEQRSPIATTVGSAGADALWYAATRGALGGAGVPGLLARFGGGYVPTLIENEANRILGNPTKSPGETAGEGVVRGTIAAAAPGIGALAQKALPFLPFISRFLPPTPMVRAATKVAPGLTPGAAESLAVGGSALEKETRRTGSNELEDEARRNARRRDR